MSKFGPAKPVHFGHEDLMAMQHRYLDEQRELEQRVHDLDHQLEDVQSRLASKEAALDTTLRRLLV